MTKNRIERQGELSFRFVTENAGFEIVCEEWGYDGMVMTDWRTLANLEEELYAGGDVKMPMKISTAYDKAPKVCDLEQMIKDGIIDRGAALNAARRVLLMMSHLE